MLVSEYDSLCRFKVPAVGLGGQLALVKQALQELPDTPKQEEARTKGWYFEHDLEWAVEYSKGDKRKGRKLTLHYGHLKGTKGADGEGLDFFMDPEGLGIELFFILNQKDLEDGGFDEHKILVGFKTEEDAKKGYLENYPEALGPKLLGKIKPMTLPEFKDWIKEADKTKEAADKGLLPFRDRSEVYALKDGKIYGGKYDNGTFGVFGGGIDPGETPEEAAAREYAEEAGHHVSNVRPIKGIDPFELEWKPPYATEAMKERAKKYRGSRTNYFMADLGEKTNKPLVEPVDRTDLGLYDPDEALKLSQGKIADPVLAQANAHRQRVLQAIRALYAKSADDVLPRLQQAKKRSVKKDYAGKHSVLKSVIKDTPGEWDVDDDATAKHVGITHKPTQFKFHAPRDVAALAKQGEEKCPEGECCPHCGARLEKDPDSGICNQCGKLWETLI